jgi:hypothetical protein
MINAFAAKPNLRIASRVRGLADNTRISLAEIGCLMACGAASALAVGLIHRSFGVPGIAILRGLLPIALGFAVVPRRSAGITMSLSAGATAAAMNAAQLGEFQLPALAGTLALGPVLDFALAGRPHGWHIYMRFAVAGMVANLVAFSSKFVAAYLGWHIPGGGRATQSIAVASVSFILCGAIAGVISAAIWFRLRDPDAVRGS